jgi:uridine phosphorylase
MSHLARGLWGYGGRTANGTHLTVQATGVGGPSAAAVISDLAGLGVRRALRLGTCVAREPGIELGSAFVISSALGFDGVSRALREPDRAAEGSTDSKQGSREPVPSLLPDPTLLSRITGIAPAATVSSHDLVLRMDAAETGRAAPVDTHAPLRDLQTAATFAVCRRLEIAAAAILVVAEDTDGHRSEEGELEERFSDVGLRALEALGV